MCAHTWIYMLVLKLERKQNIAFLLKRAAIINDNYFKFNLCLLKIFHMITLIFFQKDEILLFFVYFEFPKSKMSIKLIVIIHLCNLKANVAFHKVVQNHHLLLSRTTINVIFHCRNKTSQGSIMICIGKLSFYILSYFLGIYNIFYELHM